MTNAQAQRTIAFAVFGMAALIAVDKLPEVHARDFLGALLLALLLSALAMPYPQLAGPLALLAFLTVLMTRGVRVFGRLNKVAR